MIKLIACIFMAIVAIWMMIHGNNKTRYRDYPEISLALMVGGLVIAIISSIVGGITIAQLYGY